MSRVRGKRFTDVQQSYIRLWTAFQDAAASQRLRVDSVHPLGVLVKEKDGRPGAFATFLLRNWPFKVVSDKRKVDIMVRVHETFSDDLTKVVKATTCVAYFAGSSAREAKEPILELHYDFETPVQEAHPLFHAQLGATKWTAEELASLSFPNNLSTKMGDQTYAYARIPTAFMGFGPILAMLAADHLNRRGYRHVISTLKTVGEGYVHPECELLAKGLTTDGIPHAHHWYDERYVVQTWRESKNRHGARIACLDDTFSASNPDQVRATAAKKLEVAPREIHLVDVATPPQS